MAIDLCVCIDIQGCCATTFPLCTPCTNYYMKEYRIQYNLREQRCCSVG